MPAIEYEIIGGAAELAGTSASATPNVSVSTNALDRR
jgi:hypothetical protein